MRKIGIICIALIFVASNLFAQEEVKPVQKTKKDFSEILPQAGDFALGLDMARLTQSILSSITNAGAQNPAWAFQSDFYGKYFLTDKSALRLRLGVGINNFTERQFVKDDVANLTNPLENDPITMAKTVDTWKQRKSLVELGIGYEYRRSLWRVQGYVGGEIFGGIDMRRDSYTYGNAITETNQEPTTTNLPDWNNRNPINSGSYRGLDAKTQGFTAGASAIIGADLYLCRNLSIGAEFRLEGRWKYTNERTMTTETWLMDQVYKAEEKVKPATSSFGLNPAWGLNLMIHF